MRCESATERSFQRRLKILSLLHQGPLTYQQMIVALERDGLLSYDSCADIETVSRRRQYQFRRDLQALRLYFPIECDKKSKLYALIESPFGFSLNEKQLAALATIIHTFADKTLPQVRSIQELCAFLMSRLSDDQQKKVIEQRRSLNIELLERTDYSMFDTTNLNEIDKAIVRWQQLEFMYSSRTGKEQRHVIEPQPLSFKNGHTYLFGWSLDHDKELHFRVDYILPGTAKMLHKRSQRTRPRSPFYLLRYHLTSTLARNSISQHFPLQHVEMHSDGSATVTAQITNLFEARQILLKYGEHCIIDSPPELVEQMKVTAAHFAQVYLNRGM